MLSANEIRNVRFTTAMGGYKKEEVDILLDKVEADYEQFERTLREMNNKINELKGELEDSRSSQGNIQNILVSAQKFADQIVEEAKTKSAEIISSAQASIEKITAQEKELTSAFDKKAGERKSALESDMEKIIANAEKKHAAVEAATQECIDRQQLLFDKMKVEIAEFKAEITGKYKEHLELLASLPDTVTGNPSEVAVEASLSFDEVPTVEEYLQNPQPIVTKTEVENETEIEAIQDEQEVVTAHIVKPSVQAGFVINSDEFDIDDDDNSDEEDI